MSDSQFGGMGGMGMGGMNPLTMDPAMMAALRQQMYGQQLMALGSETTPIRSGWQALARGIQGTLGGYEMSQGQQQMQQYAQASRQAQAQQYAAYPLLGLPPAGGGTQPSGLLPGGTNAQPLPSAPPTSGRPLQPPSGEQQPQPSGGLQPYAPVSMKDQPQAPQVDLTTVTAPSGVHVSVAKNAAPQFQGLLTDLEGAGYKLDQSETGGYNARPIAGSDTWSQHAFGRAVDVNWQQNPNGLNKTQTIPTDLAHQLAAKYGLIWGGDWSGSSRDPMHFELAQPQSGGDGSGVAAGGAGAGVAAGGAGAAGGSLTSQQQQFATAMLPYAQRVSQATGVSPQVIMAQWGNESGWGTSPAAKQNNFAGIKNPQGGYATFNNPNDFADSYIQTLQKPQYAGAVNTGADANAFVKGLKSGGYFEGDPTTYANNVSAGARGLGPFIGTTNATPVATPAGYTTTGSPQTDAAQWGANLARQYRDMAINAAQSPYAAVRAMAPTYMQSALGALQYGRYQVSGYTPAGQPMMVDRATGKLEAVGAEPHLTETPQGWVDPTGRVVSPSDDTTLSTLSPKMQNGTANPQEQAVYNGAYGRRFAPKWEKDETAGGAWRLLPAPNAPTNLYTPPGFGGATPANQSGPSAGAGPALQPYGGSGGATMPGPQKVLAQQSGVPVAPGDPYSSMTPQQANTAFQADRTEATKAAAATDTEANESRVQLAQLERMRTLLAKNLPVGSDIANLGSRVVAMHWSNDADLQEFNQLSQSLVPSMRIGSGITRVTNKDMEIFGHMVPNADNSAQANVSIIDAAERRSQMALEHNQFLHDYASANGRMDGAETSWSRYLDANPIFAPGSSATRPTLTPPGQDRRAWFQQNTDPNTGALYSQITTRSGMPDASQYRGQAIRDDQGVTYVSNGQTWVKR
jgi:D-alanyl-D-alanine carboxypeptidase/Mannosyl-glycoprotein endo-beta-N-acetylglucosaminidase